MENLSEIQQFYFGKSVFITGGTGFLGKLLVEKLLRCCPGIGKLFLLVREKKGIDIKTRFDEVLCDPMFDRLKQDVPEFRQKIELMAGDCLSLNLGLSARNRDVILKQVNIIFHLAASVRFNKHLKEAIDLNVRALSDLLQLAKCMQSLDVFMHVSTAYSNVQVTFIEEEFYHMETDWGQLQKMIKNKTDAELQKILPTILAPWPNTYTFTKALAEAEIAANCGDLPVGIFRPAIVTSTANEPIQNWIDNLYGPTGLVVATGKGVLHTMHCDKNVTADIVPGDYVVNCLLASAVDVHRAYRQRPILTKPPIYNYVSSVENKITWDDFHAYCMTGFKKFPFSDMVWPPFLTLNKHATVNILYIVFLHLLPALFKDVVTVLQLKKPQTLTFYKKVNDFSSVLTYFTLKNINFCNKRTRKLWDNCSKLDKQLFPFSMAGLNWNEYFKEYVLGVQRYVLKEKDEHSLENRKLRRLSYISRFLKLVIFSLSLYLLLKLYFVCQNASFTTI